MSALINNYVATLQRAWCCEMERTRTGHRCVTLIMRRTHSLSSSRHYVKIFKVILRALILASVFQEAGLARKRWGKTMRSCETLVQDLLVSSRIDVKANDRAEKSSKINKNKSTSKL